jgi:hypothetical protein
MVQGGAGETGRRERAKSELRRRMESAGEMERGC